MKKKIWPRPFKIFVWQHHVIKIIKVRFDLNDTMLKEVQAAPIITFYQIISQF